MNKFLFESQPLNRLATLTKAKEEADFWFLAQEVEAENQEIIDEGKWTKHENCKKPPENWIKCSVHVAWFKQEKITGGSWMCRDSRGKVLLRGKETFISVSKMQSYKVFYGQLKA